jgi:superfamily I DNA and/or RNA helicase
VRLDIIYSFKGLERPVIVLTKIERWLKQGVKPLAVERLLYVACSRARHHLIVLLPNRVPLQVSRLFGS